MFDGIFQTFRQPWLSVVIFPFYYNFMEVLIVYFNQVVVKYIKSLLRVSNSADLIPAYVAHGFTNIFFVLETIQPFKYIRVLFLDFHLPGNVKYRKVIRYISYE